MTLSTTGGDVTRKDLIAEVKATACRHVDASATLIAVHLFAASAEQVCLAIEAMAGYFVGSTARTPSKASILRFAERYLPELGKINPRVALVERPRKRLATCAEAIHAAFRGGLFHDGERATGIQVVDDKHKWMPSFEPDGSARLNAIPFQAQFERGLKAYLRDLRRDDALAAKAARRSAFLAKPTFLTRDA
jgi:hypothetical protein